MCARRLCLSHYSLLNIDSAANDSEVRRAYRQAALRAHPDKGGTEELFHGVAAAFEILSCPSSRAIYDHELAASIATTTVQPAGDGSTACVSRKRPRSSSQLGRCAGRREDRKKTRTSRADAALEDARSVLQCMSVPERHRALTSADGQVKLALLTFMKQKPVACVQPGPKTRSDDGLLRSSQRYGCTRVRTISRRGLVTYQASTQFRTMRLYTREQTEFKTAIEHQMILIGMRQAVSRASAASPKVWSDPQKLSQICGAVLAAHGTTESKLGLRVMVRMRAKQWLGARLEIGSPMTSLEEAAKLQAQLLQARASSWHSFRAAWVYLMHSRKRIAVAEAEAVADKARLDGLRERFAHVAFRVLQAIKKKEARRGKPLNSKKAVGSANRSDWVRFGRRAQASMSSRMMGA